MATINDYILQNLDILINRDFLLEIFTGVKRTTLDRPDDDTSPIKVEETVTTKGALYVGKLVTYQGRFYRVDAYQKDTSTPHRYFVTVSPTGIEIPPPGTPVCRPTDAITIPPGGVKNGPTDTELETTLGRLIFNHTTLAAAFGSTISYINKPWSPEIIERQVIDLLIQGKITTDQMDTYQRNTYHIGNMTELCVPGISKRALTINPKIIARRDALLNEKKEAIARGDSVVMAQIESELIAMDKADLADDESSGFLIDKKNFAIHRKSMFIMKGMLEEFGAPGQFTLVSRSLSEGIDAKDLPTLSGEIRMGSYFRAKETAKGGEEAKFLLRVFQNVRITQDDCGSRHYWRYRLRKENVKDFLYRYIADNTGELALLTNENIGQYADKYINLRSPLYCKTTDGFCYTCMGQTFRSINAQALAMVSAGISSTITTAALKRSHGTSVGTVNITNLNEFSI